MEESRYTEEKLYACASVNMPKQFPIFILNVQQSEIFSLLVNGFGYSLMDAKEKVLSMPLPVFLPVRPGSEGKKAGGVRRFGIRKRDALPAGKYAPGFQRRGSGIHEKAGAACGNPQAWR